jgi:hypothetical protein
MEIVIAGWRSRSYDGDRDRRIEVVIVGWRSLDGGMEIARSILIAILPRFRPHSRTMHVSSRLHATTGE